MALGTLSGNGQESCPCVRGHRSRLPRRTDRVYTASTAVTTDVLRTFWVLDPFQCVLLNAGENYAVHVVIRGEAFLMEYVRTMTEARARAKALLAVFLPTARRSG